jgi:hypothetical protein
MMSASVPSKGFGAATHSVSASFSGSAAAGHSTNLVKWNKYAAFTRYSSVASCANAVRPARATMNGTQRFTAVAT